MMVGLIGGITLPAGATSDERVRDFRAELSGYQTQLQDARAVLESKPQPHWSDEEVGAYLTSALWVAFSGNLIQLFENESQATASDFQSVNAATSWPGNPFNNWEPMKVLSVDDPFSAGDLVFQPCAPGYESLTGGKIIYASFELSVYASDICHGTTGDTGSHPRNAAWACQPEGAYYTLGYWRETATRTLEKHRQREELRRQYQEQQESAK